MAYDLEFEKPLAELDKRISSLRRKLDRLKPEERVQLGKLEQDLEQQTAKIYSELTPWQKVHVARHKDRPYTLDYIRLMCDDFFELHGDRRFSDDAAIVAGPALLGDQRVMIIGHQKGRDLKDRQFRNNGMPHPDGYRKAYRAMKQAERFGMPVITLIDVPGASLALIDEERGQSEAIAANLYLMANLRVPIIATIIGEGGSGGALAISVGDRILMLEHSIYTVASPEAAASILWRDAAFAPQAAEAMKITAPDLRALNLIDGIIPEPRGGAHRNEQTAATNLKTFLLKQLHTLQEQPLEQLLEERYKKFRSIGQFAQLPAQA
jgi:acetyl-CoA carboxylase carboxyl transferase subunit alpha